VGGGTALAVVRREPLPFLGQVVLPTGEVVLVFMSLAETAES
jgi:hypothetical protein